MLNTHNACAELLLRGAKNQPFTQSVISYRELVMAFDLDEEYIVECEKALGAKIPSSYRASMRQSNGGEIETEEDTWEQSHIRQK